MVYALLCNGFYIYLFLLARSLTLQRRHYLYDRVLPQDVLPIPSVSRLPL